MQHRVFRHCSKQKCGNQAWLAKLNYCNHLSTKIYVEIWCATANPHILQKLILFSGRKTIFRKDGRWEFLLKIKVGLGLQPDR